MSVEMMKRVLTFKKKGNFDVHASRDLLWKRFLHQTGFSFFFIFPHSPTAFQLNIMT